MYVNLLKHFQHSAGLSPYLVKLATFEITDITLKAKAKLFSQ